MLLHPSTHLAMFQARRHDLLRSAEQRRRARAAVGREQEHADGLVRVNRNRFVLTAAGAKRLR